MDTPRPSSDYDAFEAFKHLYESVMKGDKDKFKELYTSTINTTQPSRPLTVSHDTLMHIAIYMKHEAIAKEILDTIKHDRQALTTKNALGDTVLHEAAATNMKELAEEMLSLAPELLSITNKLGETPLFRAAHNGQSQMFRLLADKVQNKDPQFLDLHLSRESDSTNILHISILAEYFDLAFEIAKRFPRLVNEKNEKWRGQKIEKGLIGLQLLSNNPSAFKSGTNHGLLKRLLYHCIPSENDDNEEKLSPKLELSNSEDENENFPPICITRFVQRCSSVIEQMLGSALKKINIRIWSLFREGWPMMREIYNEKKTHESALRLAKLLIKEDTSWVLSCSREDGGKISVIETTQSTEGSSSSTTTKDPNQLAPPGRQSTLPNTLDFSSTLGTRTGPSRDGIVSVQLDYGRDEEENKAPKRSNPTLINEITDNTTGYGIPMKHGSSIEPKARRIAKKASSYRPTTSLLTATSRGIVEIVKEILRVYPQAVEHVSDMGQNILHIAIKHRQLEIFRHVKKMKLPMSRLVWRIDENGYTILHHVGVMMYYAGGTLPGPALQLQEELRWFKRVRKIIPPHYAMHKSQYGDKSETPEELFRRTHENLLKEAQEWLKRTSESCSAVAVLIATVAFAAAYTVPGGSNQETGIPILLTDPFFLVFTVMDVLSLASSLTSLVMFLSILTSPFELEDFHYSLPRKLILAFTFLFFSVALTMLAFAANLILIIHLKNGWTTSIIYTLAFLPVTVFALLQFPLYLAFMDTMKSTIKVIKKVLPCLNTTFSSTCKTPLKLRKS